MTRKPDSREAQEEREEMVERRIGLWPDEGNAPVADAIQSAAYDAMAEQAGRIAGLTDLVALALPYVEEAAKDPVNKPGSVAPLVRRMKAAITKDQSHD